MKNFILHLLKKPKSKTITTLFYYYFFLVSFIWSIIQYTYIVFIKRDVNLGYTLRFILFLLLLSLFRLEAILSFFRNDKEDT